MNARLSCAAAAALFALASGGAGGQTARDNAQHTAGVLARVGAEKLPLGCSSAGNATDPVLWKSASGTGKCSISTLQDNVDGLMILVRWSTLQPRAYDDPLRTYYIDNAIYSLAHPERQSIHLAVLAGTNSPAWLINGPGGANANGIPGKVWNVFSFAGTKRAMPNPFGSNSTLFTALDNLVRKLGQTGDAQRPPGGAFPPSLAPYDDLYYDALPGKRGFVHTAHPTSTMNKIIGHISVLGPHSYDAESVLCQVQRDCESVAQNPQNAANYKLWTALEPDDAAMEAAIAAAQEKTIDIYAKYFPATFWTVDLVQRQMPFFSAGSTSLDTLRSDVITYIQTNYPRHGGVQNNSLSANPAGSASHPVWMQTALAAQAPPVNRAKLFAGLQVTAPKGFYPPGHRTFQELRSDVQTAVDLAKHMAPGYAPVDFIEFYDVEIAGTFTVPEVNGQRSGRSRYVNVPRTAMNDDPSGFMYAPLMDAHRSLRVSTRRN